eukprot:scaffold17078_cov65-Phaeocystis_antarctica.AAC.8
MRVTPYNNHWATGRDQRDHFTRVTSAATRAPGDPPGQLFLPDALRSVMAEAPVRIYALRQGQRQQAVQAQPGWRPQPAAAARARACALRHLNLPHGRCGHG